MKCASQASGGNRNLLPPGSQSILATEPDQFPLYPEIWWGRKLFNGSVYLAEGIVRQHSIRAHLWLAGFSQICDINWEPKVECRKMCKLCILVMKELWCCHTFRWNKCRQSGCDWRRDHWREEEFSYGNKREGILRVDYHPLSSPGCLNLGHPRFDCSEPWLRQRCWE